MKGELIERFTHLALVAALLLPALAAIAADKWQRRR